MEHTKRTAHLIHSDLKRRKKNDQKHRHKGDTDYIYSLYSLRCASFMKSFHSSVFLSLQSTIRRKSLMKPFFKEKKIKSFSLKSFMSRLCCDTIETRLFCYEIYVLSHFIRFVCPFVRSVIRQLIT